MPKLEISFTPEEVDAYLVDHQTARVATVSDDGLPHVVPLYFVWHDGAVFLNSTLGNVTIDNVQANGKASVVMDDGETYDALRGVVMSGTAARADDDPRIPDVEKAWGAKYLGGNEPPYRHWRGRAWFRLDPDRIASWDFRKIPEARAHRDAERAAAEEGT